MATVMATATTTMGKGNDNNGKDDNDGKDDNGGGGSIPDQHTTIKYMTAAEEITVATATATLMATATTTMMARTTAMMARMMAMMARMTTQRQGR
jgi:hypothetical protein